MTLAQNTILNEVTTIAVECCERDCCQKTDCDIGQYCEVNDCAAKCDGTPASCTKNWFSRDWEEKSISCGGEAEECIDFCDELVNCADEMDGRDCWKKQCDNGCGQYNCTMYHKQND